MRAHIPSPDPTGRIQVWWRVVTQCWFPWVAHDHPGFYTLHSSGLDSGRFQSFKKFYHIIIVLGVICMVYVCVRVCTVCECGQAYVRVTGQLSGVGPLLLPWDAGINLVASDLHSKHLFPLRHYTSLADLFTFLLWNRRSYLNPEKKTDSFVITGTWLLSLHSTANQD